MLNETPGLVGPKFSPPPADVREYFHQWLDGDGDPYWEYWQHTQDWFDAGSLPNVLLVHFNNLKQDLAGEMRRIATFLGIEAEDSRWPVYVEHCTFDYMKKHSDGIHPLMGAIFKGGGQTFINKGTHGRWKDLLTDADLAKYDAKVEEKLSPACAHWLATGELL